jgi:hypothetical protein
MICRRCKSTMYRVTAGPNPPKAMCYGCGQWVDCAKCSKCGDTRCLPCYNKAATGTPRRPTGGLPMAQDEDI